MEDITPSTGNTNKASAIQRRMSIYSQGTPETPTFKDQSFFVSDSKNNQWLSSMVCSILFEVTETEAKEKGRIGNGYFFYP